MSQMRLLSAVLASVPLLGGCVHPITKAVALHDAGNLDAALEEVRAPTQRRALEREEGCDQLLMLMEGGKIFQDGAALGDSIDTLHRASAMAEKFATLDNRPSATELVGSALVNPSVRTYRGTYSERIRIDAYQVLNHLVAGESRDAAVSAKRVAERQLDAGVLQTREIAAASSEAMKWQSGHGLGCAQAIMQQPQLANLEADAGYAAYLDPFASWIAGIAWCATGDAQEYMQGASNLQEALRMMPSHSCLSRQVRQNPIALARDGHDQVLVVFETGTAPYYKQISIPFFTPWTGAGVIPVQVPEYSTPVVTSLSVRGNDDASPAMTELLADYNQIFGAQFRRMEPEIVFGIIVMLAAKEGIAWGARMAATDGLSRSAVIVAASVYKLLTNNADLRTWRTPGANIQIAQIDRPEDSTLELSLVGGVIPATQEISLPPGQVIIVYVRSVVDGQMRVQTGTVVSAE